MKLFRNIKFTNLLFTIILLILSTSVILSIVKENYESAIGIAAIIASMAIPFCTKNLELEKHRQQFLFEKKYEIYKNYLVNFDKFYKLYNDYTLLLNDYEETLASGDIERINNIKSKLDDFFHDFIKYRTVLLFPPAEFRLHYKDEMSKLVNLFSKIKTNPTPDIAEGQARMDRILEILVGLINAMKKELGDN